MYHHLIPLKESAIQFCSAPKIFAVWNGVASLPRSAQAMAIALYSLYSSIFLCFCALFWCVVDMCNQHWLSERWTSNPTTKNGVENELTATAYCRQCTIYFVVMLHCNISISILSSCFFAQKRIIFVTKHIRVQVFIGCQLFFQLTFIIHLWRSNLGSGCGSSLFTFFPFFKRIEIWWFIEKNDENSEILRMKKKPNLLPRN